MKGIADSKKVKLAKQIKENCESLGIDVPSIVYEILEDNTEEIEELSYEWTTNEIADRVDKLIKAVNQIRKDLNK